MKYFDRLHPAVAFVYFALMIAISMLTTNPVVIAVSYLSSIVFCGMLIGGKKLVVSLCYNLPLLILLSATNPIFVHKGETILFFLNDNPVTKEAILYGVFASMMIMSVFYWFKCYSTVMTSDKFIYLFGRVIPKLSLVLSMSIAFIPKLKRKYKEIDEAQKALGIYSGKGMVDKIRSKFRVLSILLTNSLESSIDTADSMRARGYGLKGRSSYAIYKMTASDKALLALFALTGSAGIVLIVLGTVDFNFYPVLSPINLQALQVVAYAIITAFAFAPTVLEVKENVLWRCLKSKI